MHDCDLWQNFASKHMNCKCNLPLNCTELLSHTAGGVFGLFVALTGHRMPGGAVALAEGNALGKGPVVFHLFDSGIQYIRNQAASEYPLPLLLQHAVG